MDGSLINDIIYDNINMNSTLKNNMTPINFSYNGSLTQTIYLYNEININDNNREIYKLKYYFDSINDINTKQYIKIWIGETNMNSFIDNKSWVPILDFILIYDGYITIPNSSNNIIEIILQLQYRCMVTTSNIVVMVLRILYEDNNYSSENNFFVSKYKDSLLNVYRTLSMVSNTILSNLNNIDSNEVILNTHNYIPLIKLYYEGGGTSIILLTPKYTAIQPYTDTIKNLYIGIKSLKQSYNKNDIITFDLILHLKYLPRTTMKPSFINMLNKYILNLYFEIVDIYSNEKIILASEFTKISCSLKGMFFRLNMSSFNPNRLYRIEYILIQNDIKHHISNNEIFGVI